MNEEKGARNTIDVGDYVSFLYCDDTMISGTVLHVPQNTGDMWHIKISDSSIRYINPTSSCLDGVVKGGNNE